MRCVLASLGVAVALLGCGAAVHVGDDAGKSADGVDADASSSDRPSIVGGDAAPPPIACQPCSTSSECGEAGVACVASDGGGSGYCAPGCNKEGYCTPDRGCATVSDPSGRVWPACLPLGGCQAVP